MMVTMMMEQMMVVLSCHVTALACERRASSRDCSVHEQKAIRYTNKLVLLGVVAQMNEA